MPKKQTLRLTFLGTGPAVAIPRDGHLDALCVDARRGGKSRRQRSAALVESVDGVLLIDAGPDIFAQLETARPRRLDGVVLTHGHADAAGGLEDLDRWLGLRLPGRSVTVHSEDPTRRMLESRQPKLTRVAMSALRPYVPLRFGAIGTTPFRVRHSITPGFPTVGFAFGDRLAYASDVAAVPPRSMALLRGVGTLVLDAAMWFGRGMPAHLTPDVAIPLAARLKAKRLVLTQTGHTYPPHAAAERELKRWAAETGAFNPHRLALAYDGMTIEA